MKRTVDYDWAFDFGNMRCINVIVFPVFLLLATLFVKSSSGICREKFALNSVDALVHVKRHSRGQLERGKDINVFDGYSMIDIVRSNVTQLCEGKLVLLSLMRYCNNYCY